MPSPPAMLPCQHLQPGGQAGCLTVAHTACHRLLPPLFRQAFPADFCNKVVEALKGHESLEGKNEKEVRPCLPPCLPARILFVWFLPCPTPHHTTPHHTTPCHTTPRHRSRPWCCPLSSLKRRRPQKGACRCGLHRMRGHPPRMKRGERPCFRVLQHHSRLLGRLGRQGGLLLGDCLPQPLCHGFCEKNR